MPSRRNQFGGLLPFLGLLLLAACERHPAAPGRPSNVLVLTLDTTRRDLLGTYGREPSITPCLDRLAAESVVFEEAHTVVPLTLPAHASMFTGLYPVSSGVRVNNVTCVPEEAQTLAEILGQEGYSTGAAVAAYVLDPIFGLAQGFQHYDAPARRPGGFNLYTTQRRAGEMLPLALDMLGQLKPPFFFWLHLYDPHFPYAPERRPTIPAGTSPKDRERLLYEAEVAEMDGLLDGFFEQLRLRGLDQDLLLVVAADHGESLGEHGEVTHGHFVYDGTMRIPLLLRHPGLAPARVTAPVSLVDVTPTLLSLLGIRRPDLAFDGLDLTPWLRGDIQDPPDRVLALESYDLYVNNGWAPFEAVVLGSTKFVRSRRRELYDRDVDPGEQDNRYPAEEARAQALERRLDEMFTRPPHALAAEAPQARFDPQALAALGYAGVPDLANVTRPDFDSLPDSLDRIDMLERWEEVSLALASNRPQRAIRLLRELCREDPGNASFRALLGSQLLHHEPEALEEAERHLTESVHLQFAVAPTHYNLGLVYNRRAAQSDLEARQRSQQPDHDAAQVAALKQQARTMRERALAEFLIALDLEPNHPEALANAAVILRVQGQEQGQAGNAAEERRLRERSLELLQKFLEEIPRAHPDWASWSKTRQQWQAELADLAAG